MHNYETFCYVINPHAKSNFAVAEKTRMIAEATFNSHQDFVTTDVKPAVAFVLPKSNPILTASGQ